MSKVILERDFVSVEWIPEQHLLISRFKPSEKELSFLEYRALIEGVKTVVGPQPFKSVADIRVPYFTMDKEAQELAAKDEWINEYRVAEAILTDSLAFKLSLNFYLKVFRPGSETRVFSNEPDAIQWLEQQWVKFNKNR